MTDRPILFSGPMVRALLEGRKTQTRRVLKVQPPESCTFAGFYSVPLTGAFQCRLQGNETLHTQKIGYAPGDRLWVRETWAKVGDEQDDIHACPDMRIPAYYRADMVDPERQRWRPSIFMPRWASRLTLAVTDVRVQRLQDISEDDARAEGVEPYTPTCPDDDTPAADAFMDLWDSLNADRAPWDSNPWICAVSFVVHKCNIDHVGAAA